MAPTFAVLRVTSPLTGARKVSEFDRGGPDEPAAPWDDRDNCASTWPALTWLPSAAFTSVTLKPSSVTVATAMRRGITMPVTRTMSEKQPVAARTTITTAPVESSDCARIAFHWGAATATPTTRPIAAKAHFIGWPDQEHLQARYGLPPIGGGRKRLLGTVTYFSTMLTISTRRFSAERGWSLSLSRVLP